MKNNNTTEAKRWLKQAEFDFKAGQWSFKGRFFEDTCFKCQQTVEKSLKAFLYSNGLRNIIGHSTTQLLQRCIKFNKDFNKFLHITRSLDKYYITARYPNGLPSGIPHDYFDKSEAEKAISAAEKILHFVQSLIK